jgi:hypothetical protein
MAASGGSPDAKCSRRPLPSFTLKRPVEPSMLCTGRNQRIKVNVSLLFVTRTGLQFEKDGIGLKQTIRPTQLAFLSHLLEEMGC